MEDGYYWYFPADDEDVPDLEGVQVVEVFDDGRRLGICGGISYNVSDAKGRFVGPLVQPPEPE